MRIFLPLALVALAASAYAEPDAITEVGIGALSPVCDPHVSECISRNEQAAENILASLDEDENVTATKEVELGELLCESLDDASGSSELRFAMSSTETVTAERTSFTDMPGDAFSDNNERKVWRGEVIDPAPAAGTAPRVVSMAWGTPCNVETFVLKMVGQNEDGTTSISTSVPCDAGSSSEICMVQYDVDLPHPTPPLVPDLDETSSDNARLLTESDEPTGDRSARRGLQSTTQIDVLVVYSLASLSNRGVTAEQMETRIADEIPAATEAASNSKIDLVYNLVAAAPLPYTQGTTNPGTELSYVRTNAEVGALRDQYEADLVVLVGIFTGGCGVA